ncbi:hypothetical protein, partial [Peribacillus simplex]|uniref:hypothetical protein n=1 Tax=Peribacillus simplex TaxID=1478 RepID=UPI0019D5F085
ATLDEEQVRLQFLLEKRSSLISEIRDLSADCLSSFLDASVCGVSASHFFGRSVAYFFNPLGFQFILQ